MNDSCRASYNFGGQVAFVFRLPAGQVEFSGLFLTLLSYKNGCFFLLVIIYVPPEILDG